MPQTGANPRDPHRMPEPSRWVMRFATLIRPGGRILDLACGHGRHARLFAGLGHAVLAVDRDREALDALAAEARITARVVDLEQGNWPLAGERFDAIVVTNYLHRPQFPHLLDVLAPDGVLIYETFADGNARFGRPSRPEFLLQPGELLHAFGLALQVVAFEQGEVTEPAPAVIQRICALGRERPWPAALPLIG